MMNQEKRKHSRIDAMHLLNYVYTDENAEASMQGMGRTLNISEAGILLETHAPIDIGHVVSLTIGFEEQMVDIKGRVVYTKENRSNMFESGIEFFDVDVSALKILEQYIAAFNAK